MQLNPDCVPAICRRAGRLLAVITLLLGASIVSANTAPATLKVELGAVDRVVFDDTAMPIRDLRDITGSPRDACSLAIGPQPTAANPIDRSLLDISTSSGTLGFNKSKDWIGIREQSRGVDCGRVTAGQSLTLKLGTALMAQELKSYDTTLTLSLKSNVAIGITATSVDGDSETYEIRSGFSVVPGQGSADGIDGIFNCTPHSNSGPHSDATCTINITDGFYDKFVLRTLNDGEWSLAATSTFKLATGVLQCDESLSVDNDNAESGAVGTLQRLDNVDGSTCRSIPFIVRFEGDEFEFLADYRGQQTSFLWTVIWPPEQMIERRPVDDEGNPVAVLATAEPSETLTAQIPPSVQRFLTGDHLYYIDVCLGTFEFDANGALIGMKPLAGAFPDMSAADGIQYGCYIKREVEYLGDDWIQVKEFGYLQGDWTATRTLPQ